VKNREKLEGTQHEKGKRRVRRVNGRVRSGTGKWGPEKKGQKVRMKACREP